MTPVLIPLTPKETFERLRAGTAVLIDIREPQEFASGHVPGALSRPLSTTGGAAPDSARGRDIIFSCKTGMRTGANCDQLAAAAGRPAFLLDGGLDRWIGAGLPVSLGRAA